VKVEVATDRRGLPLGLVVAAANRPEAELAEHLLDVLPYRVALPPVVTVVADRGYDSDPLRDRLAAAGYDLVSPHRKNRKRPSRNDGRKLRRYKRRWTVERAIAWLHNYRRLLVRHERQVLLFQGFAQLACALIAVARL
jgi:transposase